MSTYSQVIWCYIVNCQCYDNYTLRIFQNINIHGDAEWCDCFLDRKRKLVPRNTGAL